jgi:hypothetical protein
MATKTSNKMSLSSSLIYIFHPTERTYRSAMQHTLVLSLPRKALNEVPLLLFFARRAFGLKLAASAK